MGFADDRSPANPLENVFNSSEVYVDLQATVSFNFVITQMQIHSCPGRSGIKEVAFLFLQENRARIWAVFNVTSSLSPLILLQGSTLVNY